MTKKQLAEVVEVVKAVLAESNNKAEKKATKKPTTSKTMSCKKTTPVVSGATTKAETVEDEEPTERQESYYNSLLKQTGEKAVAGLTKHTISKEIGRLAKLVKDNKNATKATPKKTTKAVVAKATREENPETLLASAKRALAKGNIEFGLHELIKLADLHIKNKKLDKATVVVKFIKKNSLMQKAPCSVDDMATFTNAFNAVTDYMFAL